MIENVTSEFLEIAKLPLNGSKMLNYLVVMQQIADNDDVQYQFPTGICLISSVLKATGRSVYTLNLNYKNEPLKELYDAIVDNDIDVVLCGGLSQEYNAIKTILDVVKNTSNRIKTIVGGGIITADPKTAMIALRNADYGVVGEGEIIVTQIAFALENNLSISDINGVVTKTSEINIDAISDINNLDILPFPDYFGFELNLMLGRKYSSTYYDREPLFTRAATVLCSRSCPYNCTFCFHTAGKKYRRRSLDGVFKEIEWLVNSFDINYIILNDEMFVGYEDSLYEFCSRIKEYGIKWWGQTRVDMVSREILKLMKNSNCSRVTFGVESADNEILKSMRKGITIEQVEEAFKCASEVGLPASGNIILGDINETKETYRNSMNWWANNRQYDITLRYVWVFPGSNLYLNALKNKVITDPVKFLRDGCPQINVTKMTDREYDEMIAEVELFKLVHEDGIIENFTIPVFEKELNCLIKNPVALWPATVPIISMLSKIAPEFLASSNLWLVNRATADAHMPGIESYGKRVYSPDIITEMNIQTVVVIHRMSLYRTIIDDIRDNSIMVQRVIHVSELFNKNAYEED